MNNEVLKNKYENWELFGKFICSYVELCGDSEILAFIDAWSHGDWSEIEADWPEFVSFCDMESSRNE